MLITPIGYQVISSHFINKLEKELIVIIPITEQEEHRLDNGFLKVKKGNVEFNIYANQIICYGEIDLSTNSDDFNVIENMNFLDHLTGIGICVPSRYNYEEHCAYSPNRKPLYYDTVNPAIVTQYKHGILGKPKRCCIFKERINARRT